MVRVPVAFTIVNTALPVWLAELLWLNLSSPGLIAEVHCAVGDGDGDAFGVGVGVGVALGYRFRCRYYHRCRCRCHFRSGSESVLASVPVWVLAWPRDPLRCQPAELQTGQASASESESELNRHRP